MKNKTLLYLLVAVVVLYGIFVMMDRTSVPTAKEDYLVKVDSAKVTEVSIFKDAQTVTLTKRDSTWFITNPIDYRANIRYVQQLLEKLDDMRIESTVTTDESQYADLEVDTSGTQLTITQEGEKSATVIVGKASSSYRQSYARRADEKEVKLIRGTYGLVLNRKLENWRDKMILNCIQADIVGVETSDLHMTRTSREARAWVIEHEDGSVDTTDWAKSTKVQAALARLQTSGFPTEEDYGQINFDRPTTTMKVTLVDGTEKTMRFYKSDEETVRYYITLDGDMDTVYRIYEGIYNQLFKKPSELMPDPAPEGT
ncbi:DUF4340 domain-containing protein [bacterium]|nr:DUF4340 domain-containing protein [bacterium]